MFKQIGKKIKVLAVVFTCLGMLGSIITGIILMANEMPEGALIMAGGILVSWISSFVLYGFGELIDQVCIIARNTSPYSGISPSGNTASPQKNSLDELLAKGIISKEEYEEALRK